jgi:hypothetical protein
VRRARGALHIDRRRQLFKLLALLTL